MMILVVTPNVMNLNHDGKLLLGIGGSVNLENPRDYSKEAKGLLQDLGIDLDAMKE